MLQRLRTPAMHNCLTYESQNNMSRHMRTTVRLSEGLMNQAKREAERRQETVTALIEQGL
jgi:predicted DNA-binding ribbon-helix-helix protein